MELKHILPAITYFMVALIITLVIFIGEIALLIFNAMGQKVRFGFHMNPRWKNHKIYNSLLSTLVLLTGILITGQRFATKTDLEKLIFCKQYLEVVSTFHLR